MNKPKKRIGQKMALWIEMINESELNGSDLVFSSVNRKNLLIVFICENLETLTH